MNANLTNTNGRLEGRAIDLVPLEASHKAELSRLLNDEAIWEFTWRKISSLEQAEGLVEEALRAKENGSQLPFAVIDKQTGRIVGTTRLAGIDLQHRNAEIGYSWLTPRVWRTAVNTECKQLLLAFCFEKLNLLRVQFSISHLNIRSQRAAERIGAVPEGRLRRARTKPDGSVHDVLLYGIVDTEWPAVRERLDGLMNKSYV